MVEKADNVKFFKGILILFLGMAALGAFTYFVPAAFDYWWVGAIIIVYLVLFK